MMQRVFVSLIVLMINCALNAQATLPLAQRLTQLDKEIASEQAKIKQLQQQLSDEKTQSKTNQQALATKLFDLQVQQVNLSNEHKQLADTLIQTQQTADDLAAQRKQTELSFTQQAQQLDIELRELPGMDELRKQVQKCLKNKSNWTQQQVQTLLSCMVQTQISSSSIQVRQVTIPTADGTSETVNLLSIGHVAFAYEHPESKTVALAMAAPEDASGYRWSDDLPPAVATALGKTFANISTSQSIINIPMDITQRMQSVNLQHVVTLKQRIQSGGLIMIPMFAMTVLALLMIAERIFTLYIRNGKGTAQATTIIRATLAGQINDAQQTASACNTAVARTLHACLLRSEIGSHAMEDAIQEQLLHEMPKLQRFLGAIAILAAVAPLLGLLGTVTGIIRTFGVIQSFGNANPSMMAGGISEALIT
ncbi:MAG TPA: hypothetical protein DCM28_11800, partial [Phycisphaerales bacterium]|nr:hypothetical protein [Phycisphaerales bacterium]